ncbi:MAG: sigma-54-dependent Fis family transcriptional regulator, partial [Candidatus Sumerlaeota bacterium]
MQSDIALNVNLRTEKTMPLFNPKDLHFIETVAGLVYCNPFLPERIEAERRALGSDFLEVDPIWSLRVTPGENEKRNVERIMERATKALEIARRKMMEGEESAGSRERELYEDVVHFVVFHRYADRLRELAERGPRHWGRRIGVWDDFSRDYRHFMALPGLPEPGAEHEAHVFACCFQIRRAFHHIFVSLVGRSLPAARLRAAIWQSIFTHDMRRYSRVLYERLADFPTLVVGPSGTGKELVASA